MNCQLMSIQGDTLGCRLDLDMDLHEPLEAESTTELKIEELDIIINRLDPDSVNEGILRWRLEHTCQARRFGLRQPWW